MAKSRAEFEQEWLDRFAPGTTRAEMKLRDFRDRRRTMDSWVNAQMEKSGVIDNRTLAERAAGGTLADEQLEQMDEQGKGWSDGLLGSGDGTQNWNALEQQTDGQGQNQSGQQQVQPGQSTAETPEEEAQDASSPVESDSDDLTPDETEAGLGEPRGDDGEPLKKPTEQGGYDDWEHGGGNDGYNLSKNAHELERNAAKDALKDASEKAAENIAKNEVGAEATGWFATIMSSEALPVIIIVVVIILFVVMAVLFFAAGTHDKAGASTTSGATSAEILKYCTENYDKYTSQADLKSIFGSSESAVSSQLQKVDFPVPGGSIDIHKKAAPCFQAVAADLKSSGISYKITDYGTFSWRPNVNNPSVLSLHSFGIAMDINPGSNPNGSGTPGNCQTDMPPAFVAIWKKYGFRWGGEYKSNCDAMHMEWLGGAPNVPIPTFGGSGSTGGAGGVVYQASHQTDNSVGTSNEAVIAGKIADYAMAATKTATKNKVSSYPSQTSLKYWNAGSNACISMTQAGTGYAWEIQTSNALAPKYFVGIHINSGSGDVIQGYYHTGDSTGKAFAADFVVAISSATSLKADGVRLDDINRSSTCGPDSNRYKDASGNPAFYSIDPGVNTASYRVLLEIGDSNSGSFWTDANMQKIGSAIASVVNKNTGN